MKRSLVIRPLLLAAACALMGGCSLSTPYPGRALFTLNVPAPTSGTAPPRPLTLRVRRLIAVAPFNTANFIYRTAPNAITADYYNTFAAAPADLLTSALVQYLRAARIFRTVIDPEATFSDQWALEGRVQDLSIDVTAATAPRAELTLDIIVLDESHPTTRVLMDRSYTERAPLASPGAPSAAAAWSICCQNIFARLATDLKALPAQNP